MNNKITCTRYHDLSVGHRVCGQGGKCENLHGHNYRIHLTVEAEQLDTVGRVMDFSVIKDKFVIWLEQQWDHKFLVWENDPFTDTLKNLNPEGVVVVPFNPTAENLGQHLVNVIGPQQLAGTNVKLVKVNIEETRKCSVTVE